MLLCKKGSSYGVFTDLLLDKSYPSDKFAGNLTDARSLFREIVASEKKRETLE